MDTQHVVNYYGQNIDLRLDSSEYYDYCLSMNFHNHQADILDLNTEIVYDSLLFDSSCLLTGTTIEAERPLIIEFGTTYTGETCNYTPRVRTEMGWTLDFVFNTNDLTFGAPDVAGGVFYYKGVIDEFREEYYADNNLSFMLAASKRLLYRVYRYSGHCHTESGYTETYYQDIDGSEELCEDGTSDDFNITITFERNNYYFDCDVHNEGGVNDLITGYTVDNPKEVMEGATEVQTLSYILNEKWEAEQHKRLGTLRFFLNGNPIYKKENWEEVIPHTILSGVSVYEMIGSGTTGSGGLHVKTTDFEIKQVKIFEEPLQPLNVKHHYLTSIVPNYSVTECNQGCQEIPVGIT